MLAPFNLQKWINENRELLKPPVNNKCLYKQAGDFIVMIVGGPNARKDYHYNESEELFYQIEGDITVRVQIDGKAVEVEIKEGEMFLLPGKIPHSPIRGENTVGLVIEICPSGFNLHKLGSLKVVEIFKETTEFKTVTTSETIQPELFLDCTV